MVKSKSSFNSEPYLTKEFKTSQKKKCQNCVLFSFFYNKIFLEKQKIHTKMEIVLKANVYAHRLLIWKEDGSLLKLGPVFSFTVKFIIMHIFSVYNNTVNSLFYASS